VKWTPPDVIGQSIDNYDLSISVASELDQNPKKFSVPASELEYHFRELSPVTQYNVTVQGLQEGKRLWFISNIFPTTDIGNPLFSFYLDKQIYSRRQHSANSTPNRPAFDREEPHDAARQMGAA
jgi:hypothetical protein